MRFSTMRFSTRCGASATAALAVGVATLAMAAAAAAAPADPGCDYGSMHPEAPAATRQFQFLIGDFDISLHGWQNGAWTPPRAAGARWNGRWGLNGMAVYDEWFDPGPDRPDGVWGVNVRTFDPQAGLWKMMWISLPERQVQDLRAEVRDGTLTMWQVYPERPGWKAEFETLDDDHWTRISYLQDPGTGEWTPQYRLAASRIPCDRFKAPAGAPPHGSSARPEPSSP